MTTEKAFEKIIPDFIAILTYLTTEQGGRKTNAFSGYRPHIKIEDFDMLTSGEQRFINVESVNLGDTVKAEIRIIATSYFAGKLEENMKFVFCEGARLIGTGVIIEITNPALIKI